MVRIHHPPHLEGRDHQVAPLVASPGPRRTPSADLTTGVNVIERPAMDGRWDFTCVMGMYSGSFTAIAPPPGR